MGEDKRKFLVSDDLKESVQILVGHSTRPPSRRNDDDEDDRPPSISSSRPVVKLARGADDGAPFSHEHTSLVDAVIDTDMPVSTKRLKQDGPEFSPDDKAVRKVRVVDGGKDRTSAEGGAKRLRRHDSDKDDRKPSLLAQEVKVTNKPEDKPNFYPENTSNASGKRNVSTPSKSLKDSGPELSPDTFGTARKKATKAESTSAKGGARRRSRWNDDDDYGVRLPSSAAARSAEKSIADEPAFYTQDSSLASIKASSSATRSKQSDGPEFSPDYSPARKVSKKKLHTTKKSGASRPSVARSVSPKSGVKHDAPANVAGLTAVQDIEEKLYAKARSGERATTPGATAVSTSKQSGTNLKRSDEPELSPDDIAICSGKKTKAKSQKEKSKGNTDSSREADQQEPETLADMPASDLSQSAPATGSRTKFRPRPPQNQTVIGAVAVDGMDGPSGNDDYYNDDLVSEAMPGAAEGTSSLPVARMADDTNQDDYLNDLGQAEPLSPDDLKGQGIRGWISQHKVLSAIAVLVVIGAVVGGAVGATLGGGSPSAPTLEPTLAPTTAPTLSGFEEIVDTLTTVTSYSVLTDPATPQNAAVTWLMREDEYGIDYTDAPKLMQRYALATIYFATVGPSWTRQLQFLTNQDDCLWAEVDDNVTYGVTECSEQGLATKLQLARNGLQGTLPEEIAGMPLLVQFAVADKKLNGTIPIGLTKLTELTDIYLFECGISGSLPQDIGNLRKLTRLALQTNDLSGSLPSSLYDLTSLESMYLSENSFSGSLSSAIGNLVSVKEFHLESNRFTGVIPSDVVRMTSLVNILLEVNEFTGGMENFCTDNINFVSFWSDCLFHEAFAPNPEVECSCCTECCRNDEGAPETCAPNNSTLVGT